jgi:hypothetical protein
MAMYPVFTWDTYTAGRDGVAFGASGATTDPRRAVRDLGSALRDAPPGTSGVICKATPAPFGAALNYSDTASLADSHAFITAHLLGGRSGIPSDEP